MFSPNLKIASAIIGVGGVAIGTGVGVYHGFIKSKEEKDDTPQLEETIAKTFESGTKKLLETNSEDTQWDTNWTAFKDAYAQKYASNNDWKFDDWSNLSKAGKAPLKFKQRCEANSNKRKKDNSKLLVEVTEHCTKNR